MVWKWIKEIILGKKLVVYEQRKALRKLYEGYPTHIFSGYLQKRIKFKEGIRVLEEDGIIKEDGLDPDGEPAHRLTAEGLRLVESWNMERLAYLGIILSLLILILTAWSIYLQMVG
ncbi:MAG: hypothetical protein KKD18_01425 [Nanoarchaeota archaeon]|nr:hypothetical protein [Nanoarchaeota archaeon]